MWTLSFFFSFPLYCNIFSLGGECMAANYAAGSIGFDTTFELNEFNEPRLRSEIETLKDVLLFILFSKPGQYPSLPTIGLDIGSLLYEFYDDIDEDKLKNDLVEQCSILNQYINNGSIIVKKIRYKNKPSLIIHIEGNEKFPSNYKHDNVGDSNQYTIGISFNEINQMIYNVNNR